MNNYENNSNFQDDIPTKPPYYDAQKYKYNNQNVNQLQQFIILSEQMFREKHPKMNYFNTIIFYSH